MLAGLQVEDSGGPSSCLHKSWLRLGSGLFMPSASSWCGSLGEGMPLPSVLMVFTTFPEVGRARRVILKGEARRTFTATPPSERREQECGKYNQSQGLVETYSSRW